jgi:hypothetical protein
MKMLFNDKNGVYFKVAPKTVRDDSVYGIFAITEIIKHYPKICYMDNNFDLMESGINIKFWKANCKITKAAKNIFLSF